MYPIPQGAEVRMQHGVFCWDSVLGLKVEEFFQQLNSLLIQPGGMETQRLGMIDWVVRVDKLCIGSDPWPCTLSGRAQDLDSAVSAYMYM